MTLKNLKFPLFQSKKSGNPTYWLGSVRIIIDFEHSQTRRS